MATPKSTGPGIFIHPSCVAAVRACAVFGILFILAAFLLFKNANLTGPIMAGDEYAYFEQSREFPELNKVLVYDSGSSKSNNAFYFWIGRLLWDHVADPALSMRVLQSLLYILIFPIVYFLCRQFIPPLVSVLVTGIACVSALSSYSAYFMPETVYIVLFFLLVTYVACFAHRPFANAFGSGFLVALLLLTKPHGLAIVSGVAASWIICILVPNFVGIRRLRSAVAFLLFFGSSYFSLIVVNALLTKHLNLSPLLFVGESYSNILASGSKSFLLPRDLATVVVGNAVALSLLIGIPFLYIALHITRRLPDICLGIIKSDLDIRKFNFFIIFVICLSFFTICMAISFTAQIGGEEVWRIHGRYYSFVIPLFIVMMFAATHRGARFGNDHSEAWMFLRAGAIIGLGVLAIMQFYWRKAYAIAPWDFPEIFALSNWMWSFEAPGIGTKIVLLGVIAFTGILISPSRTPVFFASFILAINLASLVQTTRWQYAHAAAFRPWTQPTYAIRGLLPQESLDRGLVIGTDRGYVTYVLFALRSRSRVLLLPPGSIVDAATVGGEAEWVLIQGQYDVRLSPSQLALRTDKLMFFDLKGVGPLIPCKAACNSAS